MSLGNNFCCRVEDGINSKAETTDQDTQKIAKLLQMKHVEGIKLFQDVQLKLLQRHI